jgi:hypothetical protein
LSLLLASLLLAAQAAAQTAAPQAPSSTPPTSQNVFSAKALAVQPTPDPASTHFTTDTGLLLVAVKPAATADYEAVLQAMQDALSKDTDPMRSAAARGWFVYKAKETDAKGNALYIHVMSPTVTGFDYRMSLLLDSLVKELPPELLSKYQETFAAPPTMLNLNEVAHMSVAPLPAKKQE